MSLSQKLSHTKVKPGQLAIFWVGQAGFLMKTDAGQILALDIYLSRSCERILNFKRLSASPIAPKEFSADYIFLTHFHADHLDVDAVPMLTSGKKCQIIASSCAAVKCKELGIDNDQIYELPAGDSLTDGSFTVHSLHCDHNPKAPLAVGFLFEFGKIRIYFSGDTCYREEIVKEAAAFGPQIAVLPINGAFGNLNGIDAARMALQVGSQVVIPSHFWTFIEHSGPSGDPADFKAAMQAYEEKCHSLFFEIGQGALLSVNDEGKIKTTYI